MCLMFSPSITTPSGPASATCATLEQSRFFGVFSSKTALPSTPCSWTLQNPDPRRYTVYMKITKPTESCTPRQIRTFQFDSFLETSRTYLGMESFDEVVRLCDASSTVAYLESSKQFLQVRKVMPRLEYVEEDEGNDEGSQFNAEFLVVGKRNPSMQPRDAVSMVGRLPGHQHTWKPLRHHDDPLPVLGAAQEKDRWLLQERSLHREVLAHR